MEELMIEIMHEDNINMAWYSFIHEGIRCRGYVEFEEDEDETDVIRRTDEKKGKGEIRWQKTKCRLLEETQCEDIQSVSLQKNME